MGRCGLRKDALVLQKILTILLLAAVVGGYGWGASNQYKPTPDSSEIVSLSYSVVRGDGYGSNGRTGSWCPPLAIYFFSGVVWLSEQWAQGGLRVQGMKLSQMVLALGFAWGGYVLARRKLGDARWAGWVMLLTMLNLVIFNMTMYLTTDMLYAVLSIWTLVWLDHGAGRWRWAAGGLLLAGACLTRIIGICLLAGLLVWLLGGRFERGSRLRRMAYGAAVAGVSLLGLGWWQAFLSVEKSQGYAAWFMRETGESNPILILWARLMAVAPSVPLRVSELVLNVDLTHLPYGVALLVFAVVLGGWALRVKGGWGFTESYFIFYVAVMAMMADQGGRYLMPLLPLYLIYVMGILQKGIGWIGERGVEGRRFLWVGAGVLALVAGGAVVGLLRHGGAMSGDAVMRYGFFYFVTAGWGALWCGWTLWGKRPHIPCRVFLGVLVLGYVLTGMAYLAGYNALEHRLIKNRGPMLMGYEPYYQMGQWLAEQKDITEPVFCSQEAMVHLASGKLTRSILSAFPELGPWERGSVLVYESPMDTDPENKRLGEWVAGTGGPYVLRLKSQPAREGSPASYVLYHYERKGH